MYLPILIHVNEYIWTNYSHVVQLSPREIRNNIV